MSKALVLAFTLWLVDHATSDLKELSHDRTHAILQIGE